jgi:hypothetical protein
MNEFTISRIDTDLGVFRVSGFWCNKDIAPLALEVALIEVMSTDGWLVLNPSTNAVVTLLDSLSPMLLEHLQARLL